MPTSVRLDPKTQALLERLAIQQRRSKSAVIREALRRLAELETREGTDAGPHALVSDLLGLVSNAAMPRAQDHKQAYREALERRRRP